MTIALKQAQDARLYILGEMNKVIDNPRENISDKAPAMHTLSIHPDKIRDVIGKGGATIRSITEETGAAIDIEDDGSIRVYAENNEAAQAAINKIISITAEAEVGQVYEGKVERIVDFGAFVNILPGKDGLVHISQIAEERIENVTDVLSEGQMVKVKVLDVDNRGRIKLTMKDIEADA
jgi:polyribonucleotide nucleotidyltransferase